MGEKITFCKGGGCTAKLGAGILSRVLERLPKGKQDPNLLIGYDSEVNVDSNNLTRSGYIIPAVDFKKLQEVLVITTTKQDLIDNGNQTQSDSSEK